MCHDRVRVAAKLQIYPRAIQMLKLYFQSSMMRKCCRMRSRIALTRARTLLYRPSRITSYRVYFLHTSPCFRGASNIMNRPGKTDGPRQNVHAPVMSGRGAEHLDSLAQPVKVLIDPLAP